MTFLITGASSGIGAALAQECATRGNTLFICARNGERLARVAENCRAAGAVVYDEVIDVADDKATRNWIERSNATSPLEVVFSNAGIATGIENEENIRKTFSVNVNGNLNVVLPVIELFRQRGKTEGLRQIAITASIAGYGPLKACPSYSATKSCMKTWALSLRGMLAKEGIGVSCICPGFVESRITAANTCPMPFIMSAEKAARIIWRGVQRNTALIAFPWPMRLSVYLLSILPASLNDFVNRFLPQKVSDSRT